MNGTVAREGGTTGWGEQLPGGPAAAFKARELLTARLGDALAPDRLHDVLLLTTELVTNAVLHGGVGEDAVLDLQVAARPDGLRVTIGDPGGNTTVPEMQDLDVTVPGGMGLFLVDQISTAWGVHRAPDAAVEVWFEVGRA